MLRFERQAPALYRGPVKSGKAPTNWRRVVMFVPLAAVVGILLNTFFGVADYENAYARLEQVSLENATPSLRNKNITNTQQGAPSTPNLVASSSEDWCTRVQKARSDLNPVLQIKVPCETMKPAKTAVVSMLIDGAADGEGSVKIFTATDYIHGAMALGASMKDYIDHTETHMLLLLREGFELAPVDLVRLQSVGWIIGTAPNVPLQNRYLPEFPRYKHTYTKIAAIGLSEYDCALALDADALVVGDLRELMTCNIFTEPQHRVGASLDYYARYWHYFNTGSLLWRTSNEEMHRVFGMTTNSRFMKKFASDQNFLNSVYPERLNNTANHLVNIGEMKYIENGKVVHMGWSYNAQTHVEVQLPDLFVERRPDVRILHFTEKKGWQCDETHEPPVPLSETKRGCDRKEPLCFCREARYWWDAYRAAEASANEALKALHI
eukprot:Nitzschia sp. Nitz4//scaffold79_size90958//18575//19885//NITZ4_005012-RA/size90958-processed-gene-0.106-mRNA-1//-1//CDS//3329558210//8347//frame0